jgi:hypothetical protein
MNLLYVFAKILFSGEVGKAATAIFKGLAADTNYVDKIVEQRDISPIRKIP